MEFKIIILICCILSLIPAILSQTPIYNFDIGQVFLRTSAGDVIGELLKSRGGRTYAAYNTLPYALPPIGKLRLKAPVPAPRWKGVRIATHDNPLFPVHVYRYKNYSEIVGQEDCLYLNVYAPAVPQDQYLPINSFPVLIFIPGKSNIVFDGGILSYDPNYLMDYNIVFVAINYRGGPLGFLSMEDEVIPGNFGLKDQAIALKWVVQHIGDFSGNPNAITISGEAAGGVCAALHAFSPLSSNLFQRIISESGNPLNYGSVNRRGVVKNKTKRLAERVGCPCDDSYKMLDCFQNNVGAYQFYEYFLTENGSGTILAPDNWGLIEIVVESPRTKDPFLDEQVRDSIVRPSNKEWLLGFNSADGNQISNRAFSYTPDRIIQLDENYFESLPQVLQYDCLEQTEKNSTTNAIRNRYFDQTAFISSYENFTIMIKDRQYFMPVLDTVCLYNTTDSTNPFRDTKTFLYVNDYQNTQSFNPDYGEYETPFGVSHGDELIDLYVIARNLQPLADKDLNVSRTIVRLFANFVLTGNPTPNANDSLIWNRAHCGDRYMLFRRDGSFQVRSDFRGDIDQFWGPIPICY